jgi:hypothetical protein
MSKVQLPEPLPARDEPPERLLAWATAALRREHNPIVHVQRFGLDLDARIMLSFADGEWRGRQRELMGANGLRHVMLAFDGTAIPGYDQAACGEIVARLIWAANASVQDDEREALIDDLARFLDVSLTLGVLHGSYGDDDGYRLVADFVALNRRKLAVPAVLALDESPTPPELWVPRGGLMDWLRATRQKADPVALRPAIAELGWRWAVFQRRNPGVGDDRPIARVWTVSEKWEVCPFDLAVAVANARERRA